jgi:hypothetical protein
MQEVEAVLRLLSEKRRDGRTAMEKSLTAAEKAIRSLRSGRKPTVSERLTSTGAAARAIAAMARAEELGLDPGDTRISLVYQAGDNTRLLTLSNDTGGAGEFFTKLEKFGPEVLFLGLMFQLKDRETGYVLRAVRPFMIGPAATERLVALRDEKGTSFIN